MVEARQVINAVQAVPTCSLLPAISSLHVLLSWCYNYSSSDTLHILFTAWKACVSLWAASVLTAVRPSYAVVTLRKQGQHPFLPARRYASAGLCDSDVSGRPSVRHTPVLCLVSGKVWVVEKFARGHPKGTCQMRLGWVFSAIFDQYVVISRKQCILDTMLLWDGNRKPYASYRMVSVLMTLSDPWPGFQGHGSFKRRVSPKRRILQTQLLYR